MEAREKDYKVEKERLGIGDRRLKRRGQLLEGVSGDWLKDFRDLYKFSDF